MGDRRLRLSVLFACGAEALFIVFLTAFATHLHYPIGARTDQGNVLRQLSQTLGYGRARARDASRANPKEPNAMPPLQLEPLLAAAVVVATALTDAVYVLFTNAVVKHRRLPAATWSSVWYLLSSFAVISYTNHWVYVLFAATGSFIGAYATMTYLHPGPTYPPPPVGSSPG